MWRDFRRRKNQAKIVKTYALGANRDGHPRAYVLALSLLYFCIQSRQSSDT